MRFACLLTSLAWFPSIWALPTAEDYHWQSSIIWSGVHIFPYEARGPALCFLRWLYGWFTPGLQIFRNANTACPPQLGGCLVQRPLRHSYQQRMDNLGPLHCGLLRKYIWEDAERGNFVGPWPCTGFFYANDGIYNVSISMFHWMSWWIINFGMFLSVTQW